MSRFLFLSKNRVGEILAGPVFSAPTQLLERVSILATASATTKFPHVPKSISLFSFFSKNRVVGILVGPVFFGANELPRAGIDFSDCKRNY